MEKIKIALCKDIVLMLIVTVALTGSLSYVFYSLGYLQGMNDLRSDFPMSATTLLPDPTTVPDDTTDEDDDVETEDEADVDSNTFESEVFKLSFVLPEGYIAYHSSSATDDQFPCSHVYDSLRDPSVCYDAEGELLNDKIISLPSLHIEPASSEFVNSDGLTSNYGISVGIVSNSGLGGGCPEEEASEIDIEFFGSPVVNYLCTSEMGIMTYGGLPIIYSSPESSDYTKIGISFIAEDQTMFDQFVQIISSAEAIE